MPHPRKRAPLAGWATAVILSGAMASVFMLSGGLGAGTRGAVASSSTDNGGSVVNCVDQPAVHGTIKLNKSFSGTLTLGLFYQDPTKTGGTPQYKDSMQRGAATFNASKVGHFSFTISPLTGAELYEVRVIGRIPLGNAVNGVQPPTVSGLMVSPIFEICRPLSDAKTATVTSTQTSTMLQPTTVTSTVTSAVQSSVTIVQISTTTQTATVVQNYPVTVTVSPSCQFLAAAPAAHLAGRVRSRLNAVITKTVTTTVTNTSTTTLNNTVTTTSTVTSTVTQPTTVTTTQNNTVTSTTTVPTTVTSTTTVPTTVTSTTVTTTTVPTTVTSTTTVPTTETTTVLSPTTYTTTATVTSTQPTTITTTQYVSTCAL